MTMDEIETLAEDAMEAAWRDGDQGRETYRSATSSARAALLRAVEALELEAAKADSWRQAAEGFRRERDELAAMRPEVLAFARVMSAKIDGHNHDRGEYGWRTATPARLMEWLEGYVTALSYALDASTMDAVLGKAANVANLAMMIADVCGALASPPPAALSTETEVKP